MKVLILPTLVLGATYFLPAQAAEATTIDRTSPYFHLARGGHGGHGTRGDEDRRGNESADRGANTERNSTAKSNAAKSNTTTPESRVHNLNNERNANNDPYGGLGGAYGSGCYTDSNGSTICY